MIRVANSYAIDSDLLKENKFPYESYAMVEPVGDPIPYPQSVLHIWLSDVYENDEIKLDVPQKKIIYTLKFIEGDSTTFPPGMLEAGSATLLADGTVSFPLVNLSQDQQNTQADITIQNITNVTTETIEINRVTIPIDNCKGSSEFKQTYSEKKAFTHNFSHEESQSIGAEIPAFIWAKILPELQTKYGFENGQSGETNVQFEMSTLPATNLTYSIIWEEVWDKGNVDVTSGSNKLAISYKVKTNVIYRIASDSQPCP